MAKGFARLSLFAVLLAALAAPVQASTYLFRGQCSDCLGGTGTATATLILQDYTPGDPILLPNFVSFTYDGTDLVAPYTVTPETGGVSGVLPEDLPGTAAVFINLIDPVLPRAFATELSGFWGIDDDGPDDFGYSHEWSLVPEPAAFLLLAASALALGIARRRR